MNWRDYKMVSGQQESVLWKETQKILWNLEIETDHQIPARRPDQVLINKKKKKKKKKKTTENLQSRGFYPSSEPQSENSKKAKRETSSWTMPEN